MPAEALTSCPRPVCLQYLELIGSMPSGPALDSANLSAWDTRLLEAQERRDGAAAQVCVFL